MDRQRERARSSNGIARLNATDFMAAAEAANPKPKTTAPNASHTAKYPAPAAVVASAGRFTPLDRATFWYSCSIGQLDGSIMAIIIASHISRKTPAAADVDCPGMAIHIMDITQPPGIGIPPDMPRAAFRVIAADARNTAPAMPRAHCSFRLEAGVTASARANQSGLSPLYSNLENSPYLPLWS